MKIPENIKACVAFVGYQLTDQSFKMAGTVYFIVNDNNTSNLGYAVTAKHVVEGIKSKGIEYLFLKLNMVNGNANWFKTKISDWTYHQNDNVDIATYNKLSFFDNKVDQKYYPLSRSMTKEIRMKHLIEEGDEVFITGLFSHHHGENKNIPIVRVGNISAMPDEKIQTKFHLMEGYLIEARSIGGLSGSPVFVNLGLLRYINGSIQQSQKGPIFFLMGMIYGHYDIKASEIDEFIEDNASDTNKINTGIAIVTPISKLIEHLNTIEKKL